MAKSSELIGILLIVKMVVNGDPTLNQGDMVNDVHDEIDFSDPEDFVDKIPDEGKAPVYIAIRIVFFPGIHLHVSTMLYKLI